MVYVALKPLVVDSHRVNPGDPLPACPGGWSAAHLVRMHMCGQVARVVDGHEAEFTAALRRGELPMKLAPTTHVSDLAMARLRLVGTRPPVVQAATSRKPPSGRKQA